MSRRIYIAGPMRGYPEHNIPAFRFAAVRLRALGHDVVSPVEVGDAWAGGDQSAHSAEEYVRRDVLAMLERPCCNAIALLPGWRASVGARLEATVAMVLGFAFYDANGMQIERPAQILHTGGYDQPPGDIETLDALTHEIQTWQRTTFTKATPSSVAEHLRREAVELCKAPSDAEEMADIFMLVAGAAQASGVDLVAAVRAKLDKNKARVWGVPDADGVVEHVKAAAQ